MWATLMSLLPSRADYVALPRTWKSDLLAGLTVGIVALPLALAFGVSSGVGAEAGLITAVVAGFIAAVFGGSNVQVSGPTGAMVVVLAPIVANHGIASVVIVGLLAGVFVLVMGIFRLGRAISFIPWPVIEGFTLGIAVIIFLQQIPAAVGSPEFAESPSALISAWNAIAATNLNLALWSLGVVLLVALMMVVVPTVLPIVPGSIVAIVVVTLIAELSGSPLQRIGELPNSLPLPALPDFAGISVGELIVPALAVAALAAIESLLSARVAASMANTGIFNPNRELIGQGLASLGSALFGGMPATGAIARTAVNVRSGAQTRMAAIVHSVVLLAVVYIATGPVSRIPLAALAGVLMVTAVRMVPSRAAWRILRSTKHDAFIFVITAVITVTLDLVEAVVVGILVTVLFSLRALFMRGQVHRVTLPGPSQPSDERIALFRIEGALFFGVAEKIHEEVTTHPDVTVVIIQLSGVQFLDATGAQIVAEMVTQLERDGKTAIIKGIPQQHRELITRVGVLGQLRHPNHVFDNLELAIAHARSHITREDAAAAEGRPRPFFS
ncbi:SulP family inorganic anion transporter [Aurantimicrobium sp. MWH-Uga1]|uniref:SulP family inorganic anion transporter n=1 Tax=Aurantimicrobium sp. MWH-Uga1 TaxID=2079575 RepID=UPI000DED9157|nr:SulP family inorganic anion transporter [Aurantimicrobium sp. MWH-Uga1]AXE53876.1 Bicarbonate transporter BicA [Aurantimicrobium sp. MWH-Uga1]